MDRRAFLTGAGLVATGAIPGAGIGFVSEPAVATESPTARTAVPFGEKHARGVTVRLPEHPANRLVALTIDDGPTARWTPQVLEILARRGVPATFFLVGRRAQAHPD